MIKVKTTLKESKIHPGGIGLFTIDAIKKGELVIVPSTPGLDAELDQISFDKLRKEEQEFIMHYGFKNKFNGKYHLNFDNARFINHSKEGNLFLNEGNLSLFAKRDINAGEELTQDYSEFEEMREDLKSI